MSSEYGPTFSFSGGRVIKVVFDVANEGYIDAQRDLAAILARGYPTQSPEGERTAN